MHSEDFFLFFILYFLVFSNLSVNSIVVNILILQDRNIVVLANLKPRNMRGVKSNGMLMAASDASHESVELLVPPEGAIPGERVWFGSPEEKENLPDAASPNQVISLSKIF